MANAAVDIFAQEAIPLSRDVFTQAKEDWWTVATQLVPILHRKEILDYISNKEGLTKFNEKISVEAGLKKNSIPVISNNLQKIMEFRDCFRNIDLQSAKMFNITELFQKAKKMSEDGKKLNAENVQKAVNEAIERGDLVKSNTDYIEDIESQEKLADMLSVPGTTSSQTTKKTTTARKTKPVAKKAAATKKQPAKAPKAKVAAPATDSVAEKASEPPAVDTVSNAVTTPTEPKAPAAKKSSVSKTKPALQQLVKESMRKDTEAQKPTASEPVEQVADPQTDPVTAELIAAFRQASDEQKDIIMKIAMSMQGDHDIALLKALNTAKASVLLETMSYFK